MKKHVLTLAMLLIAPFVVGLAMPAIADENKVALMWAGKSGMPKRVASGFLQGMREQAPRVEVVQKREIQDMGEAETLFKEFEKSTDGIVFLRSNGAEFLGRMASSSKVPCFVGACNNPQELGVIKNLKAPEGNITGVTYFISYDKRFDVLKQLFPNMKGVGLLLQKGHPGTIIDQEGTRDQCHRHGIAYHEVVAEDVKQLVEGAARLVGKADVFIISNTGLVIDNVVSLLPVANRAKIPMFSYAAERTQQGATAELAADDEKLGRMLAESVIDVVINKKPVSQVPVKTDSDPRLIINEGQMRALGLQFPDQVLKKAQIVK